MKYIITVTAILIYGITNATNIDSLKTLLKTELVDTNRIKILTSIGENTYMGEQDTALKYWDLGLIESEKYIKLNPKDTFGHISKAALISNIGVVYYYRGQIDTVVELWTKAAEIEASIGYEKGTIGTYNNMAQIYINNGDINKGKRYLEKGLEISKKHNDHDHIVKIISNIAYCYYLLGFMEKAIELYEESSSYLFKNEVHISNENLIAYNYGGLYAIYIKIEEYEKAYEFLIKERIIFKKTGNIREYIETINNEGSLLDSKKQYDNAINNYKIAAFKFDSINYNRGYGVALNNIGSVFNKIGAYDSALIYSRESLKTLKINNYKSGIGSIFHVMAKSYIGLNNLDSALYHANKSHKINTELGSLEDILGTSKTLSIIYEKLGDYENSLQFYQLYKTYSDSVYSNTMKNRALKSEYKFEYEAKEIQNQKEQEKNKALSDEQSLRQKIIIISVIIVLILVVVFTYIIYQKLNLSKQQNIIINEQKAEVEEKNQEILSSITYAKRIQEAILPHKKLVEKYMKNSFILYLPKDIVSGDFYWMEHIDNKLLFAAVDCTGHGVPGAFMSIVGNNGLNKAVNEQNLTTPSKILDSLNEHVVQSLQQEGETHIKDGMDIALCSLDYSTLTLEYSGAYNPLYIVRNEELIETKANKQAIGLSGSKFNNHIFQLEKGDFIFIFTDGYADQFGGPKGKKFTHKRMRELFISTCNLGLEKQRESILYQFNNWKGEEEQIDDICIIGLRV